MILDMLGLYSVIVVTTWSVMGVAWLVRTVRR